MKGTTCKSWLKNPNDNIKKSLQKLTMSVMSGIYSGINFSQWCRDPELLWFFLKSGMPQASSVTVMVSQVSSYDVIHCQKQLATLAFKTTNQSRVSNSFSSPQGIFNLTYLHLHSYPPDANVHLFIYLFGHMSVVAKIHYSWKDSRTGIKQTTLMDVIRLCTTLPVCSKH